ncbi:MAG: hypothetical protein GXY83_36275 [Rhodopirellula sp.]|nr:hypothetical protein [Rhodopirellula sp.]
MSKTRPITRFAEITILLFAFAGMGRGAEWFVSTEGNDGWSGKLAAANPAKTDGPFATLERARDELRKSKSAAPATIYLRGGQYALEEPLELTPADSGSESEPVTYCAYADEKPVISGGRPVTGWRKHDERLWVADVPWAAKSDAPFTQLFVNGRRRVRARTPDPGSYLYTRRLKLTGDPHPTCLGISFEEGDIQPWPGLEEQGRIVLFHNWVNSFNCLGSIDWPRRRILFARPAGADFLGPNIRYYVDNVFAALDAPGEWYLDQAEGRLYYYPLPEENLHRAEVIAPRIRQTLVAIKGDPALGMYVEHLVLRGLSFQHSEADLSPDYAHSVQGAHTQRGAIFAVGLRSTTIEDCEFAHLGEHAVSLREGCADNTIRRCHVFDVGGGGIYLSEGAPPRTDDSYLTARNTIDNNFIHDGGHLFRAGCGVFLGGSASYNRITHNEICDLSWMGVHLGWSWTGRQPAYTHHNEVAWNHIHHIGNGVLCDIGGIYTLGVSPGTVLHHNRIHDITRFERGREGYGGWGIYLDAGSSEIRVESNVVYDTRDGGLHLHNYGYPYGDVISNNIFAFSDDAELIRNANHEPDGNHAHLQHNIVYSEGTAMLGGNNWRSESRFTSDRNCYWSTAGPPQFNGGTFAAWQATGRDANSIVADPGFVDADGRDFRLKADSPARRIGFEEIDLSTVGLSGPAEWRELPRQITHRAFEAAPPAEISEWRVREDFEDYDAGEVPTGALAAEGGARVVVTDEAPASGRQCARFEDAAGATAWKPHWCTWFEPRDGVVRMQCSVRNDPSQPATFQLEFRDWPQGATYRSGPHLRFLPNGTVEAARGNRWNEVGKVAIGEWTRVEVRFDDGAGKPKTFSLRLTGSGGEVVARDDLPFQSDDFKCCSWVGFVGVDTKAAAFCVDDLELK